MAKCKHYLLQKFKKKLITNFCMKMYTFAFKHLRDEKLYCKYEKQVSFSFTTNDKKNECIYGNSEK